jgi:hypothetical protein
MGPRRPPTGHGASGRSLQMPPRGKFRWLPTIIGLVVSPVLLVTRGVDHRVPGADKKGDKVLQTAHRPAWAYTNPVKAVRDLESGRIDMGVDYAGSGPVLALGDGQVTVASNHDSGPPSCYGKTCWPVGGIVVYRLSDGPFAGKYVYVAENITADVSAGQTVQTGEQIATVHNAYPDMETGWASGSGTEALAIADGHQCPCGDPGNWSTIEGRNFNRLLVALGAPSGYLQPHTPDQTMQAGWPTWPSRASTPSTPESRTHLPQGSASP